MRASDELFQLIKSLSPSEKRYFKLQASFYGSEKKYLLLFDAIDAQAQYDEDALREQFKGEKFIRQLNVAKRYLYEQILKSLRINHTDASARAQILELMRNVEILYEKGLKGQALKMYEKAERMATRYEKLPLLLDMSEWRAQLNPGCFNSEEEIDATFGTIFTTLERYRNMVHFMCAHEKTSIGVVSGHPRTEADRERLEHGAAMLAEEEPGSFRATLFRNWGYATYHFGRTEYRKALEFLTRQVELFEAHPGMIDEEPLIYISMLNNQLLLLRRLSDREELHVVLAKLRVVGRDLIDRARLMSPRVRANVFRTIYLNQLFVIMSENARGESAALEHYLPLLREIEEGLATHGPYLRDDLILKFYSNLTLAYFDLKDYNRALHFNNMVLALPEAPRGLQTYYHARIIHLIIHFELGNNELLEYLIRSTYRYFRSRNIIYRLESVVLDFFRRLPRLSGREELRDAFIDLRQALVVLQDDPLESEGFRTFGYIPWLDRKIREMEGRR